MSVSNSKDQSWTVMVQEFLQSVSNLSTSVGNHLIIRSWSRLLTQNDDIWVNFGNFWQNLNTGLKKVFGIFFNLSKLFAYPRLLTLFQVSTVLGLIKLQKKRLSYKKSFRINMDYAELRLGVYQKLYCLKIIWKFWMIHVF